MSVKPLVPQQPVKQYFVPSKTAKEAEPQVIPTATFDHHGKKTPIVKPPVARTPAPKAPVVHKQTEPER